MTDYYGDTEARRKHFIWVSQRLRASVVKSIL